MRMFLALADKREKLSPERPSHHHDCVMIKSQVHWFLTKGYPATAASFWKVWIYHELAYGSLDEALQIYFAALERFRGRKASRLLAPPEDLSGRCKRI